MDQETRQLILDLLGRHGILTLATVRSDGYPQANTLQYANEGFILYFATDRNSHKILNILLCDRVSVAIAGEYADWRGIQGLSMAARARVLAKADEIWDALKVLSAKFPAYAHMLRPDDPNIAVVRLAPEWISVVDYQTGFGRTDLVEVPVLT